MPPPAEVVSYTCCKSNLPVLAGEVFAEHHPDRCHVVLLTQDGLILRGLYAGRGTLQGQALRGLMSTGAKWALADAYDGESWHQLPASHVDPGLGYFHDGDFLDTIFAGGGFATFAAYCAAYFGYAAMVGGLQRLVQQVHGFALEAA